MSAVEAAWLVGLGAIVFLDGWPVLQSMVSRPIVVGPAVGVVLGAPAEGALWGALFEAAWLGVLPVGAARTPDAGLGALLGTAVGIVGRTGDLAPAGAAVAAAVAGAWLGDALSVLHRRWNGRTAAAVRTAVAAGDLGAPGRAAAAAVARAAGLGAVVTAILLGPVILAARLLGGTPWMGLVPAGWLEIVAAAAIAVGGARLFVRSRRLAGGFALGVALVAVGWWAV